MISLDWTVLVTGAVFLFTLWALNSILFKPLFRVLDERRAQTSDLQRVAAEKLEYHEALIREYTERIKQEKQKGYQLADTMRRESIEERQRRISEARRKADILRGEARSQMEQEVELARQSLRLDAEGIARVIAARVLEKT